MLAGRHQVGLDSPVPQRRRGDAADRGHLEPGERAGVQPEVLELLPDRPHGVDRGEPDPLVAAGDQSLDRFLHLVRGARRLHRDRRHHLRDGAVLGQPGDHRAGLLLGPRHQHPPPEQRLGLEPRGDIALPRSRADDREHRRVQAGGGQRSGDLAEGARDRPLVHRRPVGGDGDRRPGVAPGGQQARRGGHDVVDQAQDDDRGVGPGVQRPVKVGVVGVQHVHRRHTGRGERHPGVRGDGRDRGHPGHDLEADALLAQGCQLLRETGERRRVAVHQANHLPAAPSSPDDELGPGGARHRLAVLAEARVEHLDVGRRVVGEQGLAVHLVQDHDVGLGQPLGAAQREQPLVAGTGTDERDLPGRRLAGAGGTHRSPSPAGVVVRPAEPAGPRSVCWGLASSWPGWSGAG